MIRLLSRKLDCQSDVISAKIQSLSFEQVQQLGDALLEFETLADLESWLENNLG